MSNPAYPCPVCQIGFCQPGKKNYLRLHRGLLVSAPDMLVWTCDICEHEEFDREALSQLETLLGIVDSENQRKIAPLDIPEPPVIRRAKS